MKHCLPIFASLLLIGLLGCSEPSQQTIEKKLPLSKDSLIDLLIDLYVADAAVSSTYYKSKDSVRNIYQAQLQKIYNLSIDKIDTIQMILNSDPDYNRKIQKEVLDSLKNLEKRLREKKKTKIKKHNSSNSK